MVEHDNLWTVTRTERLVTGQMSETLVSMWSRVIERCARRLSTWLGFLKD